MGALSDDAKLSLAALKALAKQAAADFKKACPAYEKAAKELKPVIARDGDAAELDFYRDALEEALEKVNDNMSTTEGVMNHVKDIRDKGYAKDLAADVAPILAAIGPIRARLLGFVKEGRDLGKQALKAREAADTSEGELDAELASAKDRVKDVLARVGDVAGLSKPIIAAAKKAHADGKQQGFFAERTKLHPIASRRKTLDSARDEVDRLKKKLPKDDRDRHAEAQYLIDDLTSRELDLDALDAEIKKLMAMPLIKVAAAPAPPPPKLSMVQVAKIGDKLGCDVGKNSKLFKAVNNFPHDKWVKEIAKACDMNEADVKKKMDLVNRLDFVKPFYLIDV